MTLFDGETNVYDLGDDEAARIDARLAAAEIAYCRAECNPYFSYPRDAKKAAAADAAWDVALAEHRAAQDAAHDHRMKMLSELLDRKARANSELNPQETQ